MISANLKGGLGNQMFQIAAAHALALRIEGESCFDFSKCYTPMQGHTSLKYKDNIFSKLKYVEVNFWRPIYREQTFSYSELPQHPNLILDGYFQSEKYFKDYKGQIKDLFVLNDKESKQFLKQFKDSKLPLTSIHVRRGDYLNHSDYHRICGLDYYQKAIELIGPSNFIVISDDIEWAKENFKMDNFYFSPFDNELDDLSLMASCDNNIIANSSFSWWGAYLNPSLSKKVIAPKPWFGPKGPQDTQDIIPDGWIIVE
jgi:hypothetical protein